MLGLTAAGIETVGLTFSFFLHLTDRQGPGLVGPRKANS
jgi:hypothetical protein